MICATLKRSRACRRSPSTRMRPRSPRARLDEQQHVLEIRGRWVGRFRSCTAIYADGSLEAARIARHGAARRRPRRCWCFRRRLHASASARRWRWRTSGESPTASDLPLILFQYPLAGGQGYPLDTLSSIDAVPTVRAIKDWSADPPSARAPDPRAAIAHAAGQRADHAQRLAPESSLVLGCKGCSPEAAG